MPITPDPAILVEQEKDGWGMAPRWDFNGGMTAKYSYKVRSPDPKAVLLAPNLPARMSAYSADYPNLLLTSIEPEHLGGQQFRVNCNYQTTVWNAGAGSDPPPPDLPALTNFCNFNSVQESVSMLQDVDATGAVQYGDYKINDGDGMPAYVGRAEIQATRYYAAGQTPDVDYFASLDRFPKAVNTGTIVLPPLQGSATRYTVAAEKLLYMGYKLGVTQSGLAVATHTLWYADDHKFLETKYNDKGIATISVFRRRYRKADMTALWPQ